MCEYAYNAPMKRFIFIRNAGLDLGWLETLFANIIYQIGLIRYQSRKNYLTKDEYHASKELLREGDIVLVGQSRRLSSLFIKGPFTHSMVYIGDGRCVEARGAGVHTTAYEKLFSEYDTLAIARVPNLSDEKRATLVNFLIERIGEPYDFWFDPHDRRAWFCSELVCAALAAADICLKMCAQSSKELPYPSAFYVADVEIVYSSHCVKEVDGVLEFCEPLG